MIDPLIAEKLSEVPGSQLRHTSMRDKLGRPITVTVLQNVKEFTIKKEGCFCLLVRRGVYEPFYIDQSNAEDWEPYMEEASNECK